MEISDMVLKLRLYASESAGSMSTKSDGGERGRQDGLDCSKMSPKSS